MFVKQEQWTEAQAKALPPGEHDYFDRKSGLLFNDPNKLLDALAKAASAFANSGGGHLLLGVDDAAEECPAQKGGASDDYADRQLLACVHVFLHVRSHVPLL